MINTKLPIRTIMTENPITIMEDTTMDKVGMIFDKILIHHIPVINDEGTCTGIISMNDFMQIQDKFSRFELKSSEKVNNKVLPSLLAKEVMSKEPRWIDGDEPISKAIDVFLTNAFHSLIVTLDDQLVGILTPYDILRQISEYKKELV